MTDPITEIITRHFQVMKGRCHSTRDEDILFSLVQPCADEIEKYIEDRETASYARLFRDLEEAKMIPASEQSTVTVDNKENNTNY